MLLAIHGAVVFETGDQGEYRRRGRCLIRLLMPRRAEHSPDLTGDQAFLRRVVNEKADRLGLGKIHFHVGGGDRRNRFGFPPALHSPRTEYQYHCDHERDADPRQKIEQVDHIIFKRKTAG